MIPAIRSIQAFLLLSLLFLLPLSLTAETISLSGSSTVHEIVHDASKIFNKTHQNVRFILGTGGSKKGINAVGSGEVDIGQSGRLPKEKEIKKYADLVPFKIAQDGVALIVNINNPVKGLTKKQVQDIYTGKITNWKKVGGNDAPIQCISKKSSRSAYDIFQKYFKLDGKEVGIGSKKRMIFNVKGESQSSVTASVFGPNREGVGMVSTKPGGIGFVSLGYAQYLARKGGRIKLLYVDNIAPTSENIKNDTYPLKRSLYVITKKEPQGQVKLFIDFLLSSQGQDIVRDLHYISVI